MYNNDTLLCSNASIHIYVIHIMYIVHTYRPTTTPKKPINKQVQQSAYTCGSIPGLKAVIKVSGSPHVFMYSMYDDYHSPLANS